MGTEGEEPVHKGNGSQQISTTVDHQMGESTEITEEIPHSGHRQPQNLVLEIPSRSVECSLEDSVRINVLSTTTPTPKRVNFSPIHGPTSSRMNRSSFRSLLPKLIFKFKNSPSEIEKAAALALGSPSSVRGDRSRFARTFSLKYFTPRGNKASSLPVTPISHSNPGSTHGGNKARIQLPIHRSYSVPDLNKDGTIRQIDSFGGVFRVIPTTPRVKEGSLTTTSGANTAVPDDEDDGGEHIPEEEAVCRICFVELGEGSETLKMECSCKGELALAHQDCAVKWFTIKGNKICDICKQEVRNLPVTLLRIQSSRPQQGIRAQQADPGFRIWHDVPVLVIVSMLAYFCFLEQMLVKKMGAGAIAISLPFSCILGLLASMTSTTMATGRFLWIYAVVQFILVVLLAHIFFSVLHVQAVVSVIVATFVGFGATMCGCSILLEILKWRRMWQARSGIQPGIEAGPATQATESLSTTPANQIGPENVRALHDRHFIL